MPQEQSVPQDRWDRRSPALLVLQVLPVLLVPLVLREQLALRVLQVLRERLVRQEQEYRLIQRSALRSECLERDKPFLPLS